MKQDILQLGGPHHKTCLWCEVEFMGRNNQKFCCDKHRAHYNNKNKSDSTLTLSMTFKRMKRNYDILKKFLIHSEGKYIALSDLIREGFHVNGYSRRVKNLISGEEYLTLEDIAYKINEKCTEIKIIRCKKK